MSLPLTEEKKYKSVPKRGHQGLNFNKFFNQWSQDFTKVKEPTHNDAGGKTEWLDKFKGLVGDEADLKRAAGRIKAIAIKNLAPDDKSLPQNFVTRGPFVTGMGLANPVENGFLWHHTLGVPYLPGSSIKGMIRGWAQHWLEAPTDEIARLFGRDDKQTGGGTAGQIIVFYALPVKPVTLDVEVITPHIGDWRITTTPEKSPPADWVSPNPIPFLAVKEGAEFQFALAARPGASAEDLNKAYDYLEQALEWVGAGAKTAIGFGRFESVEKLIEKSIAKEALAFSNRPFSVGERVEILPGGEFEKFAGRTGKINRVIDKIGRVQVTADDGKEGKIKGAILNVEVKRIDG